MGRSIDKRNFYRVKIEKFRIKYRVLNSESEGADVEVVNVSAGGICFLRTASVLKGEKLEILFPFKTKKIVMKAEVLRVEGREVGTRFLENGNAIEEFLDVFNSEYKLIRNYTNEAVKSPEIYPEKGIPDNEYSDKDREKDDFDMLDI